MPLWLALVLIAAAFIGGLLIGLDTMEDPYDE